jgi:hypothetical protein
LSKTSKQTQLQWRRSQVLELSSQGLSEREIGTKLQVSHILIHRDLIYLRQQDQDNIQKHIDEIIPQEHQRCRAGTNQVLKIVWGMVNGEGFDNKTKLQALAVINDCNRFIMELATNSPICNEAIKFIAQRKEQLNELEMLQKVDNRIEEMEMEEEEDKTTSEVF